MQKVVEMLGVSGHPRADCRSQPYSGAPVLQRHAKEVAGAEQGGCQKGIATLSFVDCFHSISSSDDGKGLEV